jgi:hypothetical protein
MTKNNGGLSVETVREIIDTYEGMLRRDWSVALRAQRTHWVAVLVELTRNAAP